MDKVEIEWNDASYHCDFLTIEEAQSLPLAAVKTVGYIVYDDAEKIILATSMYADDVTKIHWVIPRGCVKSIKKVDNVS